jgi:excisionase family DNA binding protein
MAGKNENLERATLTVEEAAKICGLSRGSAYTAVRKGQLPHVRIGARILIPRAALEALLAAPPPERGNQ